MILTVGFLKWDGEKWIIDQAFGPQGPTGPQGPAGVGGKTLKATQINVGPVELIADDLTYVTLENSKAYTFKITTIAITTNPNLNAGKNIAVYDMVTATVGSTGIMTITSPNPLNLGNITDGFLVGNNLNITYVAVSASVGPTVPARLSLIANINGLGISNYYNVVSYVELVSSPFTPRLAGEGGGGRFGI